MMIFNQQELLILLVLFSSVNCYNYVFSGSSNNDIQCQVKLNSTTIEGLAKKYVHHSNSRYCAYLGIPYAQPPVGSLRFQPPKPPNEQWNSSTKSKIDYKKLKNICSQTNDKSVSVDGSEDCLYLNIYTPIKRGFTKKWNRTYPVMFWIHGGSFTTGSGNYDLYGPDYLVKEGVILVTINYRLGILGFLSAPKWKIWGNMGLKDQRQALRWVHTNIEHFGGNKDRITVFGESAGAACVNYLLMDNSTRGLYKRAILQSGSSLNPWATQHKSRAKVRKLQKLLNITRKEELFNKTARELILAAPKVTDENDHKQAIEPIFNPIVEEKIAEEPIIFPSIEQQMKDGMFPDIDIMMGFNEAEGLLALILVNKTNNELENTLHDVERVIPRDSCIWKNPNGTEEKRAVQDLSDYYNTIQKFSNYTEAYVQLMGDAWLLHAIYRMMNAVMSNDRKSKLYLYKLTDDRYSIFKEHVLMKIDRDWINLPGVCHADDLGYIFSMSKEFSAWGVALQVFAEVPKEAEQTQRRMVEIWTNFAKFGDPMKRPKYDKSMNSSLTGIVWNPYSLQKKVYLDMGYPNFKMQNFAELDRMMMWDDLYEAGLKNCVESKARTTIK